MPIRQSIWKVGDAPEQLCETRLASEQQLEDMIVANPELLSDELMLIGRQEDTGFGGRIDLLAVSPDGSLSLIELKRDRTPREVVAQALDYASWVEKLTPSDISAIYSRFKPDGDLAGDFLQRFGSELDEDLLNATHQTVVVAASLDDSTERIIQYLGDRDVAINVLFFQVFRHGNDQLFSRAWLIDPVRIQSSPGNHGAKELWNGEFYVSFGADEHRSWEDARTYGFVAGGGGAWYSRTLELLAPGDRVWVKVPGRGFVGVGEVAGSRQPVNEFHVKTPSGEMLYREVSSIPKDHFKNAEDLERCEYFVPVRWLDTRPIEQAVQEIGFFGNQNTVCKPRSKKWQTTVERLKRFFPNWNQDS